MSENRSSRIPGFYNLSLEERLIKMAEFTGLEREALSALQGTTGLTLDQADHMIENVIGIFKIPLGIATNFLINGREYAIPMAIEEPSVIAGASFAAKLARAGGGFSADASEPEMIAQIQVLDVEDMEPARQRLLDRKTEMLAMADQIDPVITQLGGGGRDLEVRFLEDTAVGPMLIVHLIYDTRDAMGANVVNSVAERLAPWVEEVTGGRTHLRILSNLSDRRLARARCSIPVETLAFEPFSGERVRNGIIEAWAFAAADPYRAATHNKGIMNGIDAVLIATGNDWRATEAGAHAYAARDGQYTSLSQWKTGSKGALEGELEMPLAVGTIGGATHVNPGAKACLELLDTTSARELAEVIIAVGLAQNLSALRALATEGIQRGHMALHARQIAIAAGAEGKLVESIARKMISENAIRLERAQELMQAMDQDKSLP